MSSPHFCFSNVHFSNWLAVLHRHFISSFTNFTFWRTLVQFYIKESKIVSLCRHEIYVQSCSLPGINSTAGQRSKNPIDPKINMHLICETLFILSIMNKYCYHPQRQKCPWSTFDNQKVLVDTAVSYRLWPFPPPHWLPYPPLLNPYPCLHWKIQFHFYSVISSAKSPAHSTLMICVCYCLGQLTIIISC